MNAEFLGQLLYENEGATLDFKRDQYPFSKATDEEKSELLKDIIGFANCWRRETAYILIGVEEQQGGPAIVRGISEHLADHSLQQFVHSLTNRPVQFGYESCEYQGMQVGVIRIELQERPIYLKKDYGKLRKNEVYVRRGSSTTVQPASPDEVASMGRATSASNQDVSLSVAFADPECERNIGEQLTWKAKKCKMPPDEAIPSLEYGTWPQTEKVSIERINRDYYRDLSKYLFIHKLMRSVRLVVANTGKVVANNVHLEVVLKKGDGVHVFEKWDIPSQPKRTIVLSPTSFTHSRLYEVKEFSDEWRLEFKFKFLQPGRVLCTDRVPVCITKSGMVYLHCNLYSDNLSTPQSTKLAIDANILNTEMTVEDLKKWSS